MDATDENDELAYISELRIGRYAAILLSVLVATACLLATGLYHPTREDELWEVSSRAALAAYAEPLDDTTVISLHRTSLSCITCPECSVRVFGSGRVEYIGNEFVCAFGKHEGVADPRRVRRLVEAMVASGYFGFVWKKGEYAFDASSATSVLQHQGQSYTLDHYLGDSGAPRWLWAMEREIDQVAGSARWLPMPSYMSCPNPAGGRRVVTMHEPIEDRLSRIIHPSIVPPKISVPPFEYFEAIDN